MVDQLEEPVFRRLALFLRGRSPDSIDYHGLGSLAIDLTYRSPSSTHWRSRLDGLVSARQSREILQRVRAVVPGRLLIFKGPEIAARYPEPHHRPHGDLDVLAERAGEAHDALLQAGWRAGHAGSSFDCTHQFPGLVDGTTSLPVEVHRRLAWPAWVRAPHPEALLERAVPSRLGIAGLESLDPVDHTLQVAAHAWLHRPFRWLRDLLDVELLRRECDERDVERRAREWGLERLWGLTARANDHLFRGIGPCPLGLALLGRHVLALRPSTRRAEIAMKAIGRFAVVSPPRAVRSAFVELATKIRRDEILPRRGHAIARAATPSAEAWPAAAAAAGTRGDREVASC
jgi:hypothetical protein